MTNKNVIVALVKDKADFLIIQNEKWYRIPTKTKITPPNVRNKTAEYIAFYQGQKFTKGVCQIKYYAKILEVTVVLRKVLFPQEVENSKSEEEYYKIRFDELEELKQPIISLRHRFLIFMATTIEKLSTATEINGLFDGSYLEDKLWAALVAEKLFPEREYHVKTDGKDWIFDFAFFCKTGNIDVECDGDAYHTEYEDVISDKKRNNEVSAVANWRVLRFSTRHIEKEMENTILTIKRQIDKLGGLQNPSKPDEYNYVSKKNDQLNLF